MSPESEPLDCPSCRDQETRARVLRTAARYPALRGSRFVGSRGIRDLHVCRECEALWSTWIDQREGYRAWRSAGRSIVPIFAADTNLARIVDWAASNDLEPSFPLVLKLATMLVRRRPEGLQAGTDAAISSLSGLTPPQDESRLLSLTMLFHILQLVVERSIRGDLRPKGPREKPPTRFTDAEVEDAARRFSFPEVDGLVRLPRTHDTVGRLLWERRLRERGADSPDGAVVAVRDPSPVIRFLRDLPLDSIDDGQLRGVRAQVAFKAARRLHSLGRLPENDHAIWLPDDGWRDLGALVEPLQCLAASVRRIDAARRLAPVKRSAAVRMEEILVREPIRVGARFTEDVRARMLELRRELADRRDREHDPPALAALEAIVDLEQRAHEADANCVLNKRPH